MIARKLPDGARVLVSHFREYGGGGPLTRHEANILGITGPPQAKGGLTVVWIEFAGGSRAYGTARCSKLDNYDRRKGRTIAEGRAFKHAVSKGLIL